MCVNVCALVRMCEWVICNCVCMCVNPQRYFNFFRILNKHAAAAAASVKRCLPVGFGLDGWRWWWWWRGRGGLWPWLWGGEAAHGQGPRRTHWRLALEDFWTTTLLHQTLPTLAPSSHFQPKSLRSPSAFRLSVSLSSPSFLPDCFFLLQFPHSVDSHPDSFTIRLRSFSHLLLFFQWRFSPTLFSLPFLLRAVGFLHLRHPFSALSLLNPFTLNVPRKYLVAWLKKSKQGWFGLCVSQNTVKIVSIFKRKEHFNGALDICNGIRL